METRMKILLKSMLTYMVVNLLFVTNAVAQSNKPIIGVGDFESSFSNYDSNSIREAVSTSLSKSNKFKLIERGRLDQILVEQGLSMSGLVNGEITGYGGFEAVDYMLYGRVTQVALKAKNQLIISECQARLGLDIKIVDIATGEIVRSENVIEKDSVNISDTDSNPCRGIGLNSFDKLTAKVARIVAAKITQAIFPVKLAQVKGEQVYLNYGADYLKEDEKLKIVTLGEGFVDPDTGEVLGAEETVIGIVEVTELKSKFSIGKILMSNGTLKVGDVAVRLDNSDQRKLKEKISSCKSAKRSERKICKSEGKSCDKAIRKAERKCSF